jgi:hypothetical protein
MFYAYFLLNWTNLITDAIVVNIIQLYLMIPFNKIKNFHYKIDFSHNDM